MNQVRCHNSNQQQPPALEAVYDCRQHPAPPGYYWLCRWTLALGDEAPKPSERMFLVTSAQRMDTSPITEGHSALSPNWQYYYHSDYLELSRRSVYEPATFLSARGGTLPAQLDIPTLFRAVFSPDSQWLFGFAHTPRLEKGEIDNFYCVKCASRKVRRLFKAPEELVGFGWYPDSVHGWYAVAEGTGSLRVFKVNVRSGKRIPLRGKAAQVPFHDWDLRDPRYRVMPLGYETEFVYSPNHTVRMWIEQMGVYVEQRGRGAQQVLRHGEHAWTRIEPLDISNDGQWVLLLCYRQGNAETGNPSVRSELVALHTKTKRWLTYLSSESPHFVPAAWRFCLR